MFWGEVGKGYSIFKCLQTVRIDLWFFCLFVCWYFVYIASYALRKNKFLTFVIVIQLVFWGFFQFFQYCFNSACVCQTTELSVPKIIYNLCVHAVANFSLGLNGWRNFSCPLALSCYCTLYIRLFWSTKFYWLLTSTLKHKDLLSVLSKVLRFKILCHNVFWRETWHQI